MRKRVLAFLVFGFPVFLAGQEVRLDVDLVAQKGDQWCWAASMEMIMRYYFPDSLIDQCSIAETYLVWREGYANLNNCLGICEDISFSLSSDNNKTLPFNASVIDGIRPQPAYFDLILSEFGLFSMEDFNLLNWQQYRHEIDVGRPVILLYDADGYVLDDNINHAVIAKGYYTDTVLNRSYFLINDPWEVCQGDSFLLNRAALAGFATIASDSIKQINKVLSMVHHIAPKQTIISSAAFSSKSLDLRNQPRVLAENSDLIEAVKRNRDRFIGTALGDGFNEKEIENFQPDQHYNTPVDYLSYNYFKQKGRGTDFNKATFKARLNQVTYEGDTEVLSTMIRCNEKGDYCVVERIDLGREPEEPVAILPKGEKVQLSNKGKAGAIPFTILRSDATTFEFYRFYYKQEPYWLPVDPSAKRFFYGRTDVTQGVAIAEHIGLAGMENYYRANPWEEQAKARFLRKLIRILRKGGYLNFRRCFKNYQYITK